MCEISQEQIKSWIRDEIELSKLTPRFIPLELLNGWVNYGGIWASAQYTKHEGVVYISGLVKPGAGTIAILPKGFRPKETIINAVVTNPDVMGRVDVLSTGEIDMIEGDNAWLNLQISSIAEQ